MSKLRAKPAIAVVAWAALTAATGASAQVYKCPDASGRTVIQQIPCAGGKAIDVRPASGRASAPTPVASGAAPAPVAAAPAPVPAQAPVHQAQVTQVKSPLEKDAEMCLNWYRPRLKDPVSAYYTNPSKDGRVVSLTIHARNSFGGVVTNQAKCEINAGRLDNDWTKIHAERLKW